MWEVGQCYVCGPKYTRWPADANPLLRFLDGDEIKKIVSIEPGNCYKRISLLPHDTFVRKTIPHYEMVENGCYLITPELAAVWRLNNYITADIYKEIVDGYKH